MSAESSSVSAVSAASSAVAAQTRSRLLWLDGYRGVATLLMIETHVVNTFLARGLRNPAWFGWLDYVNGLVAPSFLFIAGFALGLAMRSGTGKPVAVGRKVRRLSEILVLGYLLHFPFGELSQGKWIAALHVGTQMDVLPCIAVALAVGVGVEWLAQHLSGWWREWFWAGMLATLSVLAVAGASPLQSWAGGPVPLAACVNQTTGSLFPLLPWAAFVFAGAWRGSVQKTGWGFAVIWLCAGWMAAWWRGHSLFSPLSPAFFVERLAWVLLLAEAFRHARIWENRTWVRLAGRESLVMYAAHLIIISALVAAGVPEASWGFAGIAAIFLAVLAGTFVVGAGKERWMAKIFRPAARVASAPIP